MLYDHETDHACNHTPQCSPEQPTNLRAHAYFRTPTSTFPLSYRDGKQEKKSSKATFIIMVISYGRYSHRRQFVLLLELNTQPCDKRYNEIFNRGLHLSVWQRKKKDSAGVQWTVIYFHLSLAKVVLHNCETILHFLNVLALNWNSK